MSIPNSKSFFENVVEEYDSIVIGAHVKPDGDAYGSSMGLKLALEFLYPEKKIYCVGSYCEKLPLNLPAPIAPGDLPLDTIKNSLVIITDTGTKKRVEDQRLLGGKFLVRIDHHPFTEHFGDIEFVDSEKSSCSVIVADMLFASFPIISAQSASAILMGMLTDSGYFRFSSDADDYSKAGRLIYNGADIQGLYNSLLARNLHDLNIQKEILSSMQIKGKFCYCFFHQDQIQQLGSTTDSLSCLVNLIGFTDECPIWAFFCEYPSGKVRIELRCTDDYDVSKIAEKYGGGGHKKFAGATVEDKGIAEKMIDDLSNL